MYLRFLSLLLAVSLYAREGSVLRVCADPNNLPYSNDRSEGFENKLAEIIARDLGVKLEYTWWSQRRGFIRNTLGAGRCDALMGVPAALDTVSVTGPYYRSTYVFVTRKDVSPRLESLDDPRLERWRIGMHRVGDDYAPPAVALARRGLAGNISGYSLYGAYGEENPPARLIHAVAAGDVDVAIVWGAFAGYFAPLESTPLTVTPLSPAMYAAVPFTFEMSIAVRKGDETLRRELDGVLNRHCEEIRALLKRYGVPLIGKEDDSNACGSSRHSVSWPH